MNAKQWFISAAVTFGLWLFAMGQTWSIAGWKGWQMLIGLEYFPTEAAIARLITLALIGFAGFSLFKGFTSLKGQE